MHTGMKWWDARRIEWYRRAAGRSHYHRALAEALKKLLHKDERILELGCGLGYATELLAKDGFMITGTDADGEAIAEARRRSGMDIFRTLDALSSPLPESDVLLLLLFGRIAEERNLESYLGSTGRMVYAVSEHRGQRDDLRKKGGEPERTEAYLRSIDGITFSAIPFCASFDQPLRSMDEAEEYIEAMYGREKTPLYMEYIREDHDGEYPYIFPNMKHLTIFGIEKEEA